MHNIEVQDDLYQRLEFAARREGGDVASFAMECMHSGLRICALPHPERDYAVRWIDLLEDAPSCVEAGTIRTLLDRVQRFGCTS